MHDITQKLINKYPEIFSQLLNNKEVIEYLDDLMSNGSIQVNYDYAYLLMKEFIPHQLSMKKLNYREEELDNLISILCFDSTVLYELFLKLVEIDQFTLENFNVTQQHEFGNYICECIIAADKIINVDAEEMKRLIEHTQIIDVRDVLLLLKEHQLLDAHTYHATLAHERIRDLYQLLCLLKKNNLLLAENLEHVFRHIEPWRFVELLEILDKSALLIQSNLMLACYHFRAWDLIVMLKLLQLEGLVNQELLEIVAQHPRPYDVLSGMNLLIGNKLLTAENIRAIAASNPIWIAVEELLLSNNNHNLTQEVVNNVVNKYTSTLSSNTSIFIGSSSHGEYRWNSTVRDYEIDYLHPLLIVNSASYGHYFEQARNSFAREFGFESRNLYSEGYYLTVVAIEIFYFSGLVANDDFYVTVKLTGHDQEGLHFSQQIKHAKNDAVIAQATLRVLCVELATGKPSLPTKLLNIFFPNKSQ